jgi:hypothetical protein
VVEKKSPQRHKEHKAYAKELAPMHCEECKDQLLELVYEEGLRPRRKLDLLSHVDNCPFCHEEYTDLLESRTLLQQWPDEETDWQLRVRPDYKSSSQPRILRFGRLGNRPWMAVKGAIAAMLLLVGLLGATQSQVKWNEAGLTVQARLWKDQTADAGERRLSDREMLKYVDNLMMDSERRQLKMLYAVWEDSQARHYTEHTAIENDLQGLQRQVQTRWDNPQNRTQ